MKFLSFLWAKTKQLGLVVFLITPDCLVNRVFFHNAFRNTVSCSAWKAREHKRWGWTYMAIDAFFGPGHCERQAAREDKYGSVWSAWWAEFKGA